MRANISDDKSAPFKVSIIFSLEFCINPSFMNLSIISRPANSDSLFALIPEAVLKDRNISSFVLSFSVRISIKSPLFCITPLLSLSPP